MEKENNCKFHKYKWSDGTCVITFDNIDMDEDTDEMEHLTYE